MIFSIGPVQSFIAKARKLEDLWGGSYILSYLIEKAIFSLFAQAEKQQIKVEMVYPFVDDSSLNGRMQDQKIEIAALPNRFICLLSAGRETAVDMAIVIEKEVRQEFKRICQSSVKTVFPKQKVDTSFMTDMAAKQSEVMLEVFWATEGIAREEEYPTKRKKLEEHLAAIKNNRQYDELPFNDGFVCTMCGEHTALMEQNFSPEMRIGHMKKQMYSTWRKRNDIFAEKESGEGEFAGRIKEGEFLCGICLGKRTARDYFQKNKNAPNYFKKFESVTEFAEEDFNYYAILKMDGDNMGQWYDRTEVSNRYRSGDNCPELLHHQWLSHKLTVFSLETVPRLVDEEQGRLVYSGGDDVLAFVPVANCFTLANKLRAAFADEQNGLHPDATASAGLVIVHKKAPLQAALHAVREMELRSKDYVNPQTNAKKDALGIVMYTRGGEKREAILPWYIQGRSTTDLITGLMDLLANSLSPNFLYTFGTEFLPLTGRSFQNRINIYPDNPQARQLLLKVEFERLLERSKLDGSKSIDFAGWAADLVLLHELMPNTLQFIHLLEILKKISKRTKRDAKGKGGII